MTEEKRKRIAAAATVTAILLIVILAAIVIYQLVIITSISRQERQIRAEIAQFEEMTKNAKDDLEYLQSKEYLYEKLLENGYHKK